MEEGEKAEPRESVAAARERHTGTWASRRKKKRVKAVSVSRDFLRERDSERRKELERRRTESPPSSAPESGPSPPAPGADRAEAAAAEASAAEASADKQRIGAGPSEPLSDDPPPLAPAAEAPVPPAVAALRTPAATTAAPRRRPERQRGRSWLLPVLLGGAAVVALALWSANRPETPPPDTAPSQTATPEPPPATSPPEALPAERPVPAEPADVFEAPLVGAGGLAPERGGYTWVVTRDGESAADQVAAYTAAGYRAGVVRYESDGRGIDRVCLGQFRTMREAQAAESDLPDGVPADRWLLRLSS